MGKTFADMIPSRGDGVGDLGLVLKYAFQLPWLKSLDLTNAYVSGSIPSGLSAPNLTTLLLGSNSVSVRLCFSVLCWSGVICALILRLVVRAGAPKGGP